jgi:hypothetical protein
MFARFLNEKRAMPAQKKPATQQDVAAGKAIFFIPKNMSRVFDPGVPLPAEGYVRRAIKAQGQIPAPWGRPWLSCKRKLALRERS